ncbi:bifunctional aspartate kinase/homoserine dehydrogenase II [Thalassotalea sp. PS06]|uniref:bifunctional aspartate kinase/homoserine dehydrogenase II n=1 Tax=Thalassotalea sp. PS06 TaxID=2594005 RepID=UPI001162DEB6|nr:bifunctional aspartate kinase/homoserine dehydrogenase II [Thalassotalea sp. PS06]QDP00049.1 aspartate kinase [Thalassotalea sp. PS06]
MSEQTLVDSNVSSISKAGLLSEQLLTNNLEERTVHKFGGSSLGTVQSIESVLAIIEQRISDQDLVVVSANGKTTDKLVEIIDLVNLCQETEDEAFTHLLLLIQAEHKQLITELVAGDSETAIELVAKLNDDIRQIQQWYLQQQLIDNSNNVLAFGEIWSSRLLAAALTQRGRAAVAIDTRECFVLDCPLKTTLDSQLSSTNLHSKLKPGQLHILTGFIAVDRQGKTHTLGRNGSDYSATLAADLIAATDVSLWTDVDGIYSADPRIVPSAKKLQRIEVSVARELGRLGNPVLHSKTLSPLKEKSIHLHINNTFYPQQLGSEVGVFGEIARQEVSITHSNQLIGFQSKRFNKKLLAVISEEFSTVDIDAAQKRVIISAEQAYGLRHYLQEQCVDFATHSMSLLAAVGYSIRDSRWHREFIKTIEKSPYPVAKVSVNEHSLVAFSYEDCQIEWVNKLHNRLTREHKNIGVIVAGTGNIGETFLSNFSAQQQAQEALNQVHLIGVMNSTKGWFDVDGLSADKVASEFSNNAQPCDIEGLLTWVQRHPFDEVIIVDITPSEQFANNYQQFFDAGIHVISANKCANTFAREALGLLQQSIDKNDCQWLSNTTVGAGLPINYALKDLIDSGHQIEEISGIFSGTLSWLFSNFDGSKPFSELVKDALDLGLSEPDPRDDLSGLDVQRKLLILARMAGFQLDLEDIDCMSLVPESLKSLSKNEFLQQSHLLDKAFSEQLAEAQANNACLRYVAKLTYIDGKIRVRVGIEALDNNHAFANLNPCDNIFLLKTNWYQDNPLIIQGPGAGREVTAAGLHSDLVHLCRQLNSKHQDVDIKGIN